MAQQRGFSDIFKTIKLLYKCDNKAFIIKILLVITSSVLPLVNLVILKAIIDALSNPEVKTLILLISAFTVFSFLIRIVGILARVNNDRLSQKLVDSVNSMLQDTASELDLSYFDRTSFYDSFHRAQQDSTTRPIRVLNDFSNIIGSLIFIVGVFSMIAKSSVLVTIIMIVGVVPSFIVRLLKARKTYKWNNERTTDSRKTAYYSQVLTSRTFAKEIRTIGFAEAIKNKYRSTRAVLVEQILNISKQFAWYDTISAAIEAIALLATLAILVSDISAGAITIGLFVMLFEALRRGISYLQSMVVAVGDLYDNKLFLSNLFRFTELKSTLSSGNKEFPNTISSSIEFCNVGFSYPESKEKVLNNFNLTIKPNTINVIDGRNGFGKTTIVKLLLRLYDCSEGEILFDGTNIKEFNLKELRSKIRVVFQDFVGYSGTIKDNIAVNAEQIDEQRLKYAIEFSNANEFIDQMPDGVNTVLGRAFGGAELSMGQWQRLAISRAVYEDKPIIIFDEPTSWVDSNSEKIFFDNLKKLSADHTIILTTHKA